MSKTDRIWALITGIVVFVFGVSWFWKGEKPPIPYLITQIHCADSTYGDCANLARPSTDFWETYGKPQYTITIGLVSDNNGRVGCYMLGTGPHGEDAIDRMPKGWTLSGSSDGTGWKVVDKKNDQKDWELNEKRYFPVEVNPEVRNFQLTIRPDTPDKIIRLYQIGFLPKCP